MKPTLSPEANVPRSKIGAKKSLESSVKRFLQKCQSNEKTKERNTITIIVLLFPPNAFCSNFVSTESL